MFKAFAERLRADAKRIWAGDFSTDGERLGHRLGYWLGALLAVGVVALVAILALLD